MILPNGHDDLALRTDAGAAPVIESKLMYIWPDLVKREHRDTHNDSPPVILEKLQEKTTIDGVVRVTTYLGNPVYFDGEADDD